MFVLVDNQISGENQGSRPSFPQDYWVDYVKVSQFQR
jgi:hypothetical protein